MSPGEQAALYDSAYIAGAKAGYNLGVDEDHAGLAQIIEARAGYLRALRTTPPSAAGEITQEQARALVEAAQLALKQIVDLDEVLNQAGHEVYGWHYNGSPEPASNFFEENDCGAIAALRAALAGVPRT